MTAVANSGAEDPAAMNVAPATSGGIFNTERKIKCLVLKRKVDQNQFNFWISFILNIYVIALKMYD